MRRVPGIKHSEVVGASFGHILIQIGVALLIVLVGCGDTPTSPSQLNTPEDSPPSTPESEGQARVAAVSVTPSNAAFGLGLTVRLTATVYDSVGHSLSDRTINWTSSDRGIATVDEMGAVTGVAVGSVIISALCEDHKAEAVITVRRVSVLVDASRDGGVWWFPQGSQFNPDLDHQGKALADYFRSLDLHVVELPRPTPVSWQLIQGHNLVVRAVACGGYSASEVSAYRRYVEDGGNLLLLDDHKRHCPTDEVGRSLGLRFVGITEGSQRLTFVPDPVTEGLDDGSLAFAAGSGVVQIPAEAKILAHLDEDSWLDVNGNEIRDSGEPVAPAVMGRMSIGAGLVIFMGDANLIQGVPQPLTDNVLQVFLPGVVTEPHGGEAGTVFLASPQCVAGCD
jgi:hypothetical protein